MRSHCSSEKQYTLNYSVGNIDINTEVLLPVFTENLIQWLVLEFLCSGEREPMFSGLWFVQTGASGQLPRVVLLLYSAITSVLVRIVLLAH